MIHICEGSGSNDAAPGGIQIASGAYTGDGTLGASNPCTLTFDFEPKVILIAENKNKMSAMLINGVTRFSGYVTERSGSNMSSWSCIVNWNGNTVSWYSTENPNYVTGGVQLNLSGSTYSYVAIG